MAQILYFMNFLGTQSVNEEILRSSNRQEVRAPPKLNLTSQLGAKFRSAQIDRNHLLVTNFYK